MPVRKVEQRYSVQVGGMNLQRAHGKRQSKVRVQKGMEESVKMDGLVWLGDGGWGWLGVEVEV